jgi:hypothetical protein
VAKKKINKKMTDQPAQAPVPTFQPRMVVRLGGSTAVLGNSIKTGEDVARLDFGNPNETLQSYYFDVAQLLQLREICDTAVKGMARFIPTKQAAKPVDEEKEG